MLLGASRIVPGRKQMTTLITPADLRKLAARTVKPDQYGAGPPVSDSEDLRRVLKLSRRHLDIKDPAAARAWTQHLRRERRPEEGPCDCKQRWGFCITDLFNAQGWMLENLMDARGGFGALGVGDGKTGLDILASLAIPGVQRALLLIPPNIKPQFLSRDYPQWSAHFKTPILAGATATQFQAGRPTLHVVTYAEVSNPKNSDLIKRINPDLIIADEAHNLGDPASARTGRFLRQFGEKPSLMLVALSGSFTAGSIKSFAHFLVLALRENAPVPLHPQVCDTWALALDAPGGRNPFPCPPGMLLSLAGPEEAGIASDTERARAGFSRRLYDTLGCIATSDPELPVGLEINERKPPPMPDRIRELMSHTREHDERPDGEQLQTPLEISAVTRRLSAGFYYRWRFPKVTDSACCNLRITGEGLLGSYLHVKPNGCKTFNKDCEDCMAQRAIVIKKWEQARKKYRSEVRVKCKDQIEFLDSPKLLKNAAERWHNGYTHNDHGIVTQYPPRCATGPRRVWESEHYPPWMAVKDTVEYERQAVWESDWLARDCVEWAKEGPGIIWYSHQAFAEMVEKIARESGVVLPHYGGGKLADSGIMLEKGDRPILASIKAHGTGKNLQHAFWRNLVANNPSDPKAWEQLIGRTHRKGQARDVVFYVYRHTDDYRDAIRTVQARARFIETTMRNRQRWAIATIGWEDDQAKTWSEADELALDTAAAVE